MDTELVGPPQTKKKILFLPIKIQGDYHRTDTAESRYDTHIALSPINVKIEGMKLKQLHLSCS